MIHVNIIGVPHVLIDGQPVQFPYKKVEGAFYYLCMNKTTTRQALIQTLWEECDEAAGRKSLREAIYRMKKLFGNAFILTSGNASISINPDVPLAVDFEHLTSAQLLERGGQGIFTHFYVKNCYEFQDWISQLQEAHNRNYLHSVAAQVLGATLATEEDIHRYQDALLRFDPYNEADYCQVMELLIRQHKWAWTVSFYHDLERSLSRELGVSPSPQAQRLWVEAVRRSKKEESSQYPPFLSRREELSILQMRIAGWKRGEAGAHLLITGEGGSGKSQLLEHARAFAREESLPLLSVSAFPNEGDIPLKIWFELVRMVGDMAEEGQTLPAAYRRLSQIFNGKHLLEPAHEAVTHAVLYQLILEMMEQFDRPLVLVIDDLQWVDEMSASLLCRLLRGERCGILLIGCCASEDEDVVRRGLSPLFLHNCIQLLPLQPLTSVEAQDYILSHLPEASARQIQQIITYTDGNPYYLSELVTYLEEQDQIEHIPPRISNLLSHRLLLLSTEENQLLNSMAIFAHPVDVRGLGFLLDWPHEQIRTVLERLVQRGLVREEVSREEIAYCLRHHYLKQYIYQRQSPAKRMLQHEKLAQQYADSQGNPMYDLPRVIYHYQHSGNKYAYFRHRITYLKQFHSIAYENFPLLRRDVAWSETLPSPEGGAKELLSLAQEVLDWQEKSHAVEMLKMEMHYILGRHQISTGLYQNGLHHIGACEQMAQLFDDTVTQTLCCKQRIFYGIQTQNTQVMAENLDRGFALLNAEEEPDQQATFLRLQGVYHLLCGRYDRAQQCYAQSLERFRNLESPTRRYSINIAACLAYQGDVYIALGDYNQALLYYKKAIAANDEAVITNGLGLFWVQICHLYIQTEQYEEAEYAEAQAIDCFRHYDSTWGRDKLEILSSYLAFHRRDYQGAETHYRRAVSLETQIQNPGTWTLIQQMEERLAHGN